jgi:predicted nuclease of predicted toxin-antitoxin system
LSLRLLVDEDTQARRLISMLREAGHEVVTVPEAGLGAESDDRVLEYARQERRIVLTRNCGEFHDLHRAHIRITRVFSPFIRARSPPRT